ncbi:hypothetical protein J7K43_00880, partial [Candidatus Calescamantes bacterium]|nr:hypothetical protein [Candidatus Calescamantes bacterium]
MYKALNRLIIEVCLCLCVMGLGFVIADAEEVESGWVKEGKIGGAFSFDGIDDRVEVKDFTCLDGAKGFTLEM